MAKNPTPVFSNILDRPMSETKQPTPMPTGEYGWAVLGLPEEGVSARKQTPQLEFTFKCLGPIGDTVDTDKLNAWLTNGDGTKTKITDITHKHVFYKTEKSLYRLKKFMKILGFDVESQASYTQTLPETPGREFIGNIKHRLSEDNETRFAYIDSFAQFED